MASRARIDMSGLLDQCDFFSAQADKRQKAFLQKSFKFILPQKMECRIVPFRAGKQENVEPRYNL